jgi:hypothetical protein
VLKKLIIGVENSCLEFNDHEGALVLLDEALEEGWLSENQYNQLVDWVVGNFVATEAVA